MKISEEKRSTNALKPEPHRIPNGPSSGETCKQKQKHSKSVQNEAQVRSIPASVLQHLKHPDYADFVAFFSPWGHGK